MPTIPPETIKAHLSTRTLKLGWPGEEPTDIPFRVLRGLCPCAVCVNEFTGVRTYFVDDAPEDIEPTAMDLIGNYAVKVTWSDGHRTGIYTWEYLRKVQSELEKNLPENQNED